jgi:hypothetical protein
MFKMKIMWLGSAIRMLMLLLGKNVVLKVLCFAIPIGLKVEVLFKN